MADGTQDECLFTPLQRGNGRSVPGLPIEILLSAEMKPVFPRAPLFILFFNLFSIRSLDVFPKFSTISRVYRHDTVPVKRYKILVE